MRKRGVFIFLTQNKRSRDEGKEGSRGKREMSRGCERRAPAQSGTGPCHEDPKLEGESFACSFPVKFGRLDTKNNSWGHLINGQIRRMRHRSPRLEITISREARRC